MIFPGLGDIRFFVFAKELYPSLSRPVPLHPLKRLSAALFKWRQAGKQHRRFFESRAQATIALRAMLLEKEAHGNNALELKPSDREMLLESKMLVEPVGGNLLDAVRYYVQVQNQIRGTRAVSELSSEFQAHKDRAGIRHRYKKDLRRVMEHFCEDFGNRLAAGIDSAELTRWLEGRPTQWEKMNHRRVLSAFFSHAKGIGSTPSNPVDDVPKPRLPVARCEIFTVAETRKLLLGALEHEPLLVPWLAIGLFGGVRSAELDRLSWGDITETAIRIEPPDRKDGQPVCRRLESEPDRVAAPLQEGKRPDPAT
jgi:hypothetical protein